MRIALRVTHDPLRRALADLLRAAGHDVDALADATTKADLVIVSEPSLAPPARGVPTLCLRPPLGGRPDPDPEAALRRALAMGGTAIWAPPIAPARLLAAVGHASGPAARDAAPAEVGLDLAPDPWLLFDVSTGIVRWANEAARHAVVAQREATLAGWVGAAAPELAHALAERADGRRRVEGAAGTSTAIWWTEPSGLRVVGILHGPPDDGTAAAGNVRTLTELGRAISVLAHELRNPIASLAGAFDVLASAESADDRAEVIGLARARLGGMRLLLDDVLRYARPMRGDPVPVDVASVLASAEASMRADPRFERCRLEHVIPADAVTARAHEEPLRQAMVNLLVNAAEAQGGGGVVRTTLAVEGGWVVIRVHDEGPGIAPEHAERVFEPFWTTKSAGTGLGLAHVRRVAEAAGGRACVEPAPRGACFRIDLPLFG